MKRLEQEEDEVPSLRIIGVAVAFLVISAIGVATMYWEMEVGRRVDQPLGGPGVPPEIGREEIGMVFQRTFDDQSHRDGQHLRGEQARKLTSYGWIDRDRGTVHEPIEVAMQRYLEGERP